MVEADVAGGCSPPLPELTEGEWGLLVNAPAFRMSTSMHYTSKHRRRNPSSRTISSAGRSSKAASQPGEARPGSGTGADAAAGDSADAGDSSASDSEGESDDGDDPEEQGGDDGEAERRRAQKEVEADTADAMHFGKVDEAEVEAMSSELRSEVCPRVVTKCAASAVVIHVRWDDHTRYACQQLAMGTQHSVPRGLKIGGL